MGEKTHEEREKRLQSLIQDILDEVTQVLAPEHLIKILDVKRCMLLCYLNVLF